MSLGAGSKDSHHASQTPWALALGALGIVYGDIGTSPLYAIKECFHGIHAIEPNAVNVLGVLSLVFWSLTVVVSIKYIVFIMRADNRGEGGIFALLALLLSKDSPLSERARTFAVISSLFGAALLYGDGIITPAISVLSAIEGLEVATKSLSHVVMPLTAVVLVALFMIQKHGTGGIGKIFGPVMIVWFVTIGLLGLVSIVQNPEVLRAVNPWYALDFFIENRMKGFIVLGSVVLCITGGEALYADMGHFGRTPIRLAWMYGALPSLLLNYFGQGALLLRQPEFRESPFYGLVPWLLLYPMVLLAMAATVIASQALISGVFSLTRQAVQLGYLPRVEIIHTSDETQGQIYIPGVNWALMLACLGLVVVFQESSRLAAAYGIAVTLTMGITSAVYFLVLTRKWKVQFWKAATLVGLFLVFDLTYFAANALKLFDGGWLPLLVAVWVFLTMTTWKAGRQELARRVKSMILPLDLFLKDVARTKPHRVPGTAVFMFSSPDGTPPALLHHIKHTQVLHKQVVILSILSTDVPYVPASEQLELEELGHGFYRLVVKLGFMESPNVLEIMRRAHLLGLITDPANTSFYLGRESLLSSGRSDMSVWRKHLFVFISRNSRTATDYFGIPPGRVVELGMQIKI